MRLRLISEHAAGILPSLLFNLTLEMHWLICAWLALPGALFWTAILTLPWQPWRNREVLDSVERPERDDLADVTVLIPARNEASMLRITLPPLLQQGERLQVIWSMINPGMAPRTSRARS